MAKKSTFQVPFEKSSGSMHDKMPPTWSKDDGRIEWRDNYEFDATMTVGHLHTCCGSNNVTMADSEGRYFVMYTSDFVDMAREATINNGVVTGKFTFRKVGRSFGVKYVK